MFFKKRQDVEAPIVHATDDDFPALISAPGLTVVDFWAPWCGPCRMMTPILDELALEQEPRGVRVMKVNVDQAPATSELYGVQSIPTIMFFWDGDPLFEMVGAVPKPVLEREIDEVLNHPGGSPSQSVDTRY